MDKKRKEEEVLELTADEIDELVFEEQLASGEYLTRDEVQRAAPSSRSKGIIK